MRLQRSPTGSGTSPQPCFPQDSLSVFRQGLKALRVPVASAPHCPGATLSPGFWSPKDHKVSDLRNRKDLGVAGGHQSSALGLGRKQAFLPAGALAAGKMKPRFQHCPFPVGFRGW